MTTRGGPLPSRRAAATGGRADDRCVARDDIPEVIEHFVLMKKGEPCSPLKSSALELAAKQHLTRKLRAVDRPPSPNDER